MLTTLTICLNSLSAVISNGIIVAFKKIGLGSMSSDSAVINNFAFVTRAKIGCGYSDAV